MCAPACDTRDGEQRRDKLLRDAEHRIQKAAVEIDVGTDGLSSLLALVEHLRRDLFDLGIQLKLVVSAFFHRELFDLIFEDRCTGVGHGVYGVADTVDQTLTVKCLLVEDLFEVCGDLIFVRPIRDVLFDVGKHLCDLDVCTAVAGTFQGAEGSRHCRIGIGARRGDNMVCKGRVVTAAVLGMQDQCDVEDARFQLGILFIAAEHQKDVFRHRAAVTGIIDVERMSFDKVVVGMVGIQGDHRQYRDQLQTLRHNIGDRGVICVLVV